MKRSKTLFWFLTLLHGAVVILVSRSERRTKEVPKGPNSVCFYRFESKVLLSVCFYRFWRRLFRKEVGDDDQGVAGRGPDVQDTDFAPGLVACWMRSWLVELVVIFLRMRQRSKKIFAHLNISI